MLQPNRAVANLATAQFLHRQKSVYKISIRLGLHTKQ